MSTWIEVGGPEWKQIKKQTKIQAYKKWVGSKEIPKDESLYNVRWDTWVEIFLCPQDAVTIQLIRDLYTKKSGKAWKTAKLSEVEEVVRHCNELTYPIQQIYLGRGTVSNGSTPSEYLKSRI